MNPEFLKCLVIRKVSRYGIILQINKLILLLIKCADVEAARLSQRRMRDSP